MKGFLRYAVILSLCVVSAYGKPAPKPPQNEAKVTEADPGPMVGPVQPVMADNSPAEESGFSMLRAIGGLGIVLCLLVGGYFAARKLSPQYFVKGASERSLKVIETLAMGDRRSIAIIQVANSRFLVGNTPHQINLLTSLPEPTPLVSEPDALPVKPKISSPRGAGSPFRKLFEVEKNETSRLIGNPLPDDLRTKMRQLREALER
jgi:flagellar biosynthetic protein FliO